ncbi:DUF4031 domain-containing protein [Streptomyces sp. 5-10]|nr:DUF4031 domain-containing protein [Streptomyces sp. 5-10]
MQDWTYVAWRKGLYYTRWCHLTSDTREELHAFAGQLGLKRSWFQDHEIRWHYDLTPGKRAQAVRLGATEIDHYKMAKLMKDRRAALQKELPGPQKGG